MNAQSTVKLRTGAAMPIIGLGTWQLTNDTAAIVTKAIELGYRMIDTSGDYGTQPGVGEGVSQANIEREQLFIVTKVEETDDAYEAALNNLAELGMDYVDLLLIHRPPSTGFGQELWEGLIRAKNEGLTKDIGVSNYSIKKIQQLIDATGEIPAVNQIEWSPFGHSLEMLEYCRAQNIVIQAYSPLTRVKKLRDVTLQDLATMYRKTPAQILLRWCIQLGCVPLPKASSPEHLQENLGIFDFELSDDDMATLNGLNELYSTFIALPYV